MTGAWRVLLSVLSGSLFLLASPDLDLWPLAWFSFVPLFFAIRGTSPGRALLLGWLAGAVACAGGFSWITTLLIRFGSLSSIGALSLSVLFVLYQSFHWGASAYLLRKMKLLYPHLPLTLLAPISMSVSELLMPFVFDWYLGISQAWVIPVIQVADLAGPIGVTFLLMVSNGMLFDAAEALAEKRALPARTLIAGSGVLAAALTYGLVRIHQVEVRRAGAPKVKVGIVQPNIGIHGKGLSTLRLLHHRLHLRESLKLQERGAELIVWPESSYSYGILRDRTTDYPEGDTRRVMQGLTVPVLFGAFSYDGESPYLFNSAFMMTPDGQIVGRFDKNVLLLYGEYVPLYDTLPSLRRWLTLGSHFRRHLQRGTEVTTFPFRDKKIGPTICYEDILPSFGRRLSKLNPNLLVNLTNDSWFGGGSEPYQHLALAVYRSVELRLDMVRATNTGVSAFIEATGRVGARSEFIDPVLTPGVSPTTLLGEAALISGPTSVYAAVGDLFAYVNLAVLVVLLTLSRHPISRRRRDDER